MGSIRLLIGKLPSPAPRPDSFGGHTRTHLSHRASGYADTLQHGACESAHSLWDHVFLGFSNPTRSAQVPPNSTREPLLRRTGVPGATLRPSSFVPFELLQSTRNSLPCFT